MQPKDETMPFSVRLKSLSPLWAYLSAIVSIFYLLFFVSIVFVALTERMNTLRPVIETSFPRSHVSFQHLAGQVSVAVDNFYVYILPICGAVGTILLLILIGSLVILTPARLVSSKPRFMLLSLGRLSVLVLAGGSVLFAVGATLGNIGGISMTRLGLRFLLTLGVTNAFLQPIMVSSHFLLFGSSAVKDGLDAFRLSGLLVLFLSAVSISMMFRDWYKLLDQEVQNIFVFLLKWVMRCLSWVSGGVIVNTIGAFFNPTLVLTLDMEIGQRLGGTGVALVIGFVTVTILMGFLWARKRGLGKVEVTLFLPPADVETLGAMKKRSHESSSKIVGRAIASTPASWEPTDPFNWPSGGQTPEIRAGWALPKT